MLEDLNAALNSPNAILAISADVPALLMRLMRCPGLRRDPAFFALIQRADSAPGDAPAAAWEGSNGKACAPLDSATSTPGQPHCLSVHESSEGVSNGVSQGLRSLPLLASCHSAMTLGRDAASETLANEEDLDFVSL